MATPQTGYAPVNGLQMYYEIHGAGAPLLLLHGSFGLTMMFDELVPKLAQNRQVIVADMQAHGRTGDIDRPLSLEAMGDDVAALIRHLGLAQADVMGYSMGGGVALQAAIQHPALVRRLVVVSIPYKRSGWYAEQVAAMDHMGADMATFMKDTPMYAAYASVAPNPDNFTMLCKKIGEMVRHDYDYSAGVKGLTMPVLLMFGDADGLPPTHAAEFFALLGGGLRDGSWDRSGMSKSQLAILPSVTHYDIYMAPLLPAAVAQFLEAPDA